MKYQKEKNLWIYYYREMKRIRLVEAAIANHYYDEGRPMRTPIHLCDGQEAIAVGVCSELSTADIIFSNHRSHGHFLAKGGSLNKMIAELYTKHTGCCKGRGGSMHLMDREAGVSLSSSIVGGNVSIGTGYALANNMQEKNNVIVIFLGDGASEEGNVYESISFAKLKGLPVIFICENNLYAISTDLDVREPGKNISMKFSNILPTYEVDGNNVLLVAQTVQELIRKAKRGEGPQFMECKTYRLRDHSNIGTGIESGYRSRQEWEQWQQKCPILKMEKLLVDKELLNIEQIKRIEEEIAEEIAEAFKFALESENPDARELFAGLWG